MSVRGAFLQTFIVGMWLVLTSLAASSASAEVQFLVTWIDNATDEDGFKIERSTGGAGSFAQVATTEANVTSYVDPHLTEGTLYCYRVRAFNTVGDSSYSDVVCGTTPHTFPLTIVRAGGGTGTVVSAPAGLTCGTNCSTTFVEGTAVTLTATPAPGDIFSGWTGGACSSNADCRVTMTTATAVTATFEPAGPPTFAFTVNNAGNGTGLVTSSPPGINCGAVCSAGFQTGTVVTLTAVPTGGALFTGWTGALCVGTGACTITVSGPTAVSFGFLGPPGQPVPLPFADSDISSLPTYKWNAVPTATQYLLYVEDAGIPVFQQWLTAAQVGCPTGVGICSFTPPAPLLPGPVQWWLQTHNDAGPGPWGGPSAFVVSLGRATLLTPLATSSPTPTYSWNAVPGSGFYFLYVEDVTGARFQQWFTAAELGCTTFGTICSATPNVALSAGNAQWFIRTLSAAGASDGLWSSASFTVAAPSEAAFISP